jgi:hypothetical protein
MVLAGIDEDNLHHRGFGDSKPVDPKNQEKNRRVEINVIPEKHVPFLFPDLDLTKCDVHLQGASAFGDALKEGKPVLA